MQRLIGSRRAIAEAKPNTRFIFAMNQKNVAIVSIAIACGGFLLLHSAGPVSAATAQPATMQTSAQRSETFGTLTSAQLAAMLQKKDFFFVNVHVPYAGEIKNTDAFIAYDKIADNLAKLPADKDAKIVLYCRSGHMSSLAARELTRLGYSQVSHLGGGMVDWKKNGYEIIQK